MTPIPHASPRRRLRFELPGPIAAVAALVFVSAAASAGADPTPPDPTAAGLSGSVRLELLVERIKHEQRRLETLEADFEQEKSSEFLARPELSRGSFSYRRPDRVRWEYLSPKPITLVLRDQEMLTWYRDLGRAERVRVGRVSAQVFQYLNASGSLESLLSYFAVTFAPPAPGEPWRLELKPRYARIAKRLASMTLWIDPTLYLPTRVRYVEPNGDATEYRLARLRPNVVVPAERFALELPDGVEVRSVDLGGARGGAGAP